MTLTWMDVRDMQQRLPDLLTNYKLATLAEDHGRKATVGNEIHEIGDRLAQHLAGCSIEELIAKWTAHQYRPTLRGPAGSPERMLADIYDLIAAARGMDVRAYRGTEAP